MITNTDYQFSSFLCPVCNKALLTKKDENGVTVWCGRDMKICPSTGANEGAHGKNESEAYSVLKLKLSK